MVLVQRVVDDTAEQISASPVRPSSKERQRTGDDSGGNTEPPPWRFAAIDLRNVLSCGLRGDGTVTCWGAVGSAQRHGLAR